MFDQQQFTFAKKPDANQFGRHPPCLLGTEQFSDQLAPDHILNNF